MIGKCRHCGSDEIVTDDIVPAESEIVSWTKNETTGKMEPEYSGWTEAIWDAQMPSDPAIPYVCEGCRTYLSIDDILFEEEPTDG
jgi:hypothetical protein